MVEKRNIQVCVISDLHLGTFGCQSAEIIRYLKGIHPEILVLNGDIIDIWQFNKRFFPQGHMQVIKEIFSLLSKGCKVYYITGNHDELLRKYTDLSLGNLELTNKLVLELDGKKTWIFHGDIFDASTRGWAKFMAKLGGKGYDLLILINSGLNFILKSLGREKMSFSKKVKQGVKEALKWINDFETTAAELAIENGYDYVICGHIHQPQERVIQNENGSVIYLNSGDWVENLTALEYNNGQWKVHQHLVESPVQKMSVKYKQISLKKANIL